MMISLWSSCAAGGIIHDGVKGNAAFPAWVGFGGGAAMVGVGGLWLVHVLGKASARITQRLRDRRRDGV